MKTYTIKPLVWVENDGTPYINTVIGRYGTAETSDGFWWRHERSGWRPCASLADGKAQAEAHYIAKMEEALEVVA